uniref:Ras-GAP domain-containing protein n=1 Tax=Meloidogyne javanica TaxID=6303 RepID=A0A915LRJ1_MELJA
MALGDFIRQLLSSDLSCEVDPLRLCNGNASSSGSSSSGSGSSISSQLEKSRQQLTRQVETAWRRILACQHLFPYPLRLLFSGLRHRLEQAGRAELTDNLNEYPTGQAARNLTLIAKSLQTLANFTRFGGKEGYMEFMNNFVEREWRNMQHFLRQISAPCARYCQACEAHDSMVDCTIDLGKELSLLASYMREHCDQLMEQRKENLNLNKNSNTTTTLIAIKQLWNSLMTIIITATTKAVPENLWRQQPPPIPMARRTVMIPQPIEISYRGNLYGGGEGCQPISAPPVPNSPFSEQKTRFSFSPSGNNNNNSSSYVSTAAVHHLNTSDDYTILPPPSASRALNAGVVIAHRGVASHEATQRRGELCTPRVIQRNAFRAVDDEADDESESEEDGRVQEIVEENEEFNQRRPPPNSRRRRPPSANGYTNSSIISHVRNCSSGEQQQQHYGIFNESINNFDSSSASVGSNNRKKNIGGINQMIIPPSSGYQSQLNSKAQRCQIVELTRQNAALRQELNSVRAISSQHVVAGREEKIIASTESM